jgi:hypothetical protein
MTYDNPSIDDLEQFRNGLLKELLFEPTTDPGFVRPAEKLHFLVHQSEGVIVKLRQIVDLYDKLNATVSKVQDMLDNEAAYMDAVWKFAIAMPSIRPVANDLRAIASLPAQEREHQQRKREQETQLQQEARDLFVQFLPLQAEPAKLRVECSISQLLAAQLWLFLERSGNAVTKGTKQLFPAQGPPASLGEVFSDGFDEIANEVGLGSVTPVMHIFKAIFDFIRRREINEKKSDTAWDNIKLNSFLLSYFAWWTEGDGSSTIENIVEECIKRQRLHVKAAETLNTNVKPFLQALYDFGQNISSSQSSLPQTA